MNDLKKCYDPYGDLELELFFIHHYNLIPSRLSLEIPLEVNKEGRDGVFKELNLEKYQLETIRKIWHISKEKNPKNNEDFPAHFLMQSKSNNLIMAISLANDFLAIHFLYDKEDKTIEDWILSTTQNIRNVFGKTATPTFKVLAKGMGDFHTKEIKINPIEVDIDKLYNDDFKEINDIIENSLEIDQSGLILLHGIPGTGKTSYIKSLFGKHDNKSFIYIPNDFVNELLQPEFISFLLANKNSILLIEDAEKIIINRDLANTNSVVSTILQLTDGLFSDYLNIKIICTFNTNINKIDKALLRKGRMLAFYEFNALKKEKSNKLLESLGHAPENKEMTLAQIFNFEKKSFNQNSKGSIGFKG